MIPSLNYAVLTDALNALKEGNLRHCEALGFTFDEMDALNQLSLDELFIVSRSSAPFVAISVRHDVLRGLMALARQETRHQQLINRAIRLGVRSRCSTSISVSPPTKPAFAAGCWVSECRMAGRLNRTKRRMPKSGGNGRNAGWVTLNPPTRWTP